MGGFNVLDASGEDIAYGEKQTTRISSPIFLSFVDSFNDYKYVSVTKRIC